MQILGQHSSLRKPQIEIRIQYLAILSLASQPTRLLTGCTKEERKTHEMPCTNTHTSQVLDCPSLTIEVPSTNTHTQIRFWAAPRTQGGQPIVNCGGYISLILGNLQAPENILF